MKNHCEGSHLNCQLYCKSVRQKLPINHSFQTGTFPNDLKIARITPIFKKGDKSNPGNYRPIASLPFISKIIKRCMANKLLSFFKFTHFLSELQYGFRKGISTVHSLVHFKENIYWSLNEKKYHLIVFIDLSKALHTVNHLILLRKLDTSGSRGNVLDWFGSYLAI